MKKNLFQLSCALSVFFLLLSACTGNKTKMLVGKWSLADFIKDGKSYKKKQLDSMTTMGIRTNITKFKMNFNADGTFDDTMKEGDKDKKGDKTMYKLSKDAKKLILTNSSTKDSLSLEVLRITKDTIQFVMPTATPSEPKISLVFYKNN